MDTIKEVATLADVSIATVSHYLNKTKFVADEMIANTIDAEFPPLAA